MLFGSPASAIVDAADTNGADLIVMGTHGHGALMHVMMGNVAERVVRTAPCPVLTVREPRAREVRRVTPRSSRLPCAAVLIAALLLAPARPPPRKTRRMKQTTPRRRGLPHLLRELPWHVGAR